MKRYLLSLSLLAALMLPMASEAQIPRVISYQGILTDSSGTPKPDGTYLLTFRICGAPSGGATLWEESKSLSVKKGLFSTLLGDGTPFQGSVDFRKPYWLGIQIDSDPELSPRVTFSAVAYSLSSLRADSAGHADSAAYAQSAQIPDGALVRSVNGLHDNIVLVGAGGATVTSQADSIIVTTAGGGGGSGIQGVQNTNNTLDISNPTGPTATVNVKLPFSASSSSAATTFAINNLSTGSAISGTSPSNDAVVGSSGHPTKSGVWGSSTGSGWGVAGTTATGFAGVFGSGPNNGVFGLSAHPAVNAAGVFGKNDSTGTGVLGQSLGQSGTGVFGLSSGQDGTGVLGRYDGPASAAGWGVFGYSEQGVAGVYGAGGRNGVFGQSSSTFDAGVFGDNSGDGAGVSGHSANGVGGVYGWGAHNGVYGTTASAGDAGVYGNNESAGSGVKGVSAGGLGVGGYTSGNGHAVAGFTNGSGNALYGSNTGTGSGVVGLAFGAGSSGVEGLHGGNGYSVHGYMSGSGRAGFFEVTNASNSLSGLFATHNGTGNCFAAVHSGTGRAGYFEINNAASGATALYVTTNGSGLAAEFNGNVAVKELQINGGSDMAEPFETAANESYEPGSLLVLHASAAGKVTLSSSAYDRRVVGVVSGAGGVKPGLTLRQEEAMTGNILVAIAGRVYCKAEALSAAIEPGDLLTTSAVPGYAMKAGDESRSRGAVIGKALSGLEGGTGLVLVLVNLQ